MPTTRATPRHILAAACRRVGLARPRPRRRRDTWIRDAIGPHWPEQIDLLWLERAQAYLAAAWTASRRRDADTCERMLHGALTMLRLGEAWAYYEDCPVSEHDPDMNDLGLVYRYIPPELSIGKVEPEHTLVVYYVQDDGPVVGEESWMEGFGLARDGYMLDDGSYREAFVEPRDAAAAARGWHAWPKRGRGLPYLDSDERREAREEEAGDPATPHERLRELATDPADDVLTALAANPAAPADVLITVLEESDHDVRWRMAEREHIPRELLAKMLEFGDPTLSGYALELGHFTPEMAEELATNRELVAWLVQDQDFDRVPPEALPIMARWPELRDEVMEHPDFPADQRPDGTGVSRIIRRTYTIQRWTRWDDELHACATEFHERFGVFPNILLANEVTFARIDMAARKESIVADDGTEAAEGEHTPLSSFVGPDYEMELAIDDKLADADVSLIYDTDPDGGGEPVPEEDTVVESVGGSAEVRASAEGSGRSCSC